MLVLPSSSFLAPERKESVYYKMQDKRCEDPLMPLVLCPQCAHQMLLCLRSGITMLAMSL